MRLIALRRITLLGRRLLVRVAVRLVALLLVAALLLIAALLRLAAVTLLVGRLLVTGVGVGVAPLSLKKGAMAGLTGGRRRLLGGMSVRVRSASTCLLRRRGTSQIWGRVSGTSNVWGGVCGVVAGRPRRPGE